MPRPEHFDPLAVPVQPAATVMLLRDDPAGLSVLMLRRTAAAVFAGGMYVFPGGRVDPADGAGDDGYLVAAVRECYEEAGVLLADDSDGRPVADGHPALGHRHEVHGGRLGILDLCARYGLRPAVDRLAFAAHWVTPVGEPRRFDTRFFAVAAPDGQSSAHDDAETDDSVWVHPADALDRQRAGDLAMLPPTMHNLRLLAAHHTAADVVAAVRAAGTPEVVRPRIRSKPGEPFEIALPGDDDYDQLI